MIDEEATKEAFGYYSKDLKPQSNKPIMAACDGCGKMRKTPKDNYRALCRQCVVSSEEYRTKQSAAQKGKHQSEDAKAKNSAANTGEKNHNYGTHLTEERKAMQSASMKGEKNPNWQGGISFEPYCPKFNNAFKDYIRSKFEFKCFLCNKIQEDTGRALSVHHVNYNKNCGCDGDKTCNFVPLCIRCHTKTNYNRDYWQKTITDKLHSTIIGWAV